MSESDDKPTEVEVLGVDEQEGFRRGMAAMREQLKRDEPAARARAAQAAQDAAYGIGDRLYMVVEVQPSVMGRPVRFRGECIAGLPRNDLKLVVYGKDLQDVLFEARHEYLTLLVHCQVETDSKAARDRAVRAHFEVSDVRGLS